MDFAFGTLSTDALKLYHHQLRGRGLRHGYQLRPRVPEPHVPITLLATTGVDQGADGVACYYTTDGSEPVGSRGVATHGEVRPLAPVGTEWDTFLWGYTGQWAVTLPALPAGTRLRYRIGAWAAGEEETFADYPDLKWSSEEAAGRHFNEQLPPDPTLFYGDPQPGTLFTLTIGQPPAPAWAHEAILYHLMVDRFYPGDGAEWRQTDNLTDFCGGTLAGVVDKLDYIASLGVTALWLSPLFASPTAHGYDVTDYRQIEPRLGDAATLRRLIDGAHERGLRVLLDLACNHLSNQHPLFQAALADPSSPYRDWFFFDETPVGYRGFFGVSTMPEVDLTHPDARDWMVENGLYWLREFDIDGYRLDYASGARPDFWSIFVDACKREKGDSLYIGEIVDTPDQIQNYAGRLDGVLDFHVNHALRQHYGWRRGSERDLDRFLDRHSRYMSGALLLPAFLDNHDMDRFLYVADGDKRALLSALERLMTLPNPPILYYGTEVGLSQRAPTSELGLEASREVMPWGAAQDGALLEQVRALIARRRAGG